MALFAACGGDTKGLEGGASPGGSNPGPDPLPGSPDPNEPSSPSAPDPSAKPLPAGTPRGSAQAELEFDRLRTGAARMRGLDAAQLLEEYSLPEPALLDYAPSQAEFMDRIQASALALDAGELSVLNQQGFVVSSRRQFPSFLRGYAAIYMEHLPVFVSADALLDALHRSYDEILLQIEYSLLQPELSELLRRMLSRLEDSQASEQAKADLRLYLEVAAGLLAPDGPRPAPGEKLIDFGNTRVSDLITRARAASGMAEVTLFGVPRLIDFSQFTPRGHYTELLPDYFRAMMWLGRIDFRLIETLPDGSVEFRRAQYEAMLALEELMDERSRELWSHIDDSVRAFVGESDSMTVPEVSSLVGNLGGQGAAALASDAEVAAAIVAGGYGEQQIASHLMVNDGTVATLPLNRSFMIFGQRYIADSHVFSEVVFDRIAGRMMPSPLDAAFAALGNNQALQLHQELSSFPELPGALGAMRFLIDAHDEDFWAANLYNSWTSALRALSPDTELSSPEDAGLPSIAGTEAWGRRLLATQLGSWAQLRHDTLLYAKQSYSGIPGCEFPDAYVEPYPEFFAALVSYAERGNEIAELAAGDAALGPAVSQYFETLRATASLLGQMAEQQRSGAPHSEAQLAFINDAVRVEERSEVCTTVEVPDGWYADLFFNRDKSLELDPTIADVHTQPADEAGNIVGRILHVGTGMPRLMAITVDTCVGPRAYAGMAFSYHEQITENFERLTDEAWSERLTSGPAPAEVPWVEDFVAD